MVTKEEAQKILARRKSSSSKKVSPTHETGAKRKRPTLIDDEAEEVENWEEEEEEEDDYEQLSQLKGRSPLSESVDSEKEEKESKKEHGFLSGLKSKLHLTKKKRKIEDTARDSPTLQANFRESLQKVTTNVPLLGQAELLVFHLFPLILLDKYQHQNCFVY